MASSSSDSSEKLPIVEFVPVQEADLSPKEFEEQEWAVLQEVNRRVAARQSIPEVVQFLFESTRDICDCDRIGLAFLEEEGRRVVAHYAHALYEPLLLNQGYAQDIRDSSLQQILDTGHVRLIHDLEAYGREHPNSHSTHLILKEGVRSSMTSPIIVEGRQIGFLFRSSRKPRSFSHHSARNHYSMAERLSQAVEKAWRIERLEAANSAYMEMLGFVSHELKSPLASLIMDSKVLLQGFLGDMEPKQREKVERMAGKAGYLLGMVGDYLDLAKIEQKDFQPNLTETDFEADILQHSLELVSGDAEKKEQTLEIEKPEPLPRGWCDPNLLMIVLNNFLSNAVKYGEEGGEICIRLLNRGDDLYVGVRNSGPGFPEAQRSQLFRKFSRLQTPELLKRKGTGVGLYTSWRIILAHQGRIEAESREGEWAEFYFQIPWQKLETNPETV